MMHSTFEELLSEACNVLTKKVKKQIIKSHSEMEQEVISTLKSICCEFGINSQQVIGQGVQKFPDIAIEEYGIEVKHTISDKWRCIGNSVSEGHRNKSIKHIYLIYGKMGGSPEVRWSKYENAVTHVRSTHRLRFEIDMTSSPENSIFRTMGVTYDEFMCSDIKDKMKHCRKYARKRQEKRGEYIWWLGDA